MSKKYTIEDLNKVPLEVLHVWICDAACLPIGHTTYCDAVKRFPEYFLEEIVINKRWMAIPLEVHDDYNKELKIALDEFHAENPRAIERGIMNYVNATDLEQRAQHALDIKSLKIEKDLRRKYYSKYNI